MSHTLRQRVALLLAAVMALVPLQALHAAWSGQAMADHCQHSESRGMSVDKAHTRSHKADCCASQASGGEDPSGHQCNNACDLCGGATAAVLTTPVIRPPALRDIPVLAETVGATIQRHSPLLRPPSQLR